MPVRDLKQKLDVQRELAENLGPFVGKWVAVSGDKVVASAKGPSSLMHKIGAKPYDRIFRVPSKGLRLLL